MRVITALSVGSAETFSAPSGLFSISPFGLDRWTERANGAPADRTRHVEAARALESHGDRSPVVRQLTWVRDQQLVDHGLTDRRVDGRLVTPGAYLRGQFGVRVDP